MIVGNIVTDVDFDYDESLMVFNTVEEIPKENTLPTLIVGRTIAIDFLKENYLVNNRRLNDKLWWTFGIKEIRQEFENDLPDFIEHCFNILVKDVEYYYIDPIQDDTEELKKRFKDLDNLYLSTTIIGFIHDDNMVYLYGNKKIYGIDLSVFEFVGWDKNLMKKRILGLTKGRLNKNNILIDCKEEIEFLNDKIKYVPFIHQLKNDQNRTFGDIHRGA